MRPRDWFSVGVRLLGVYVFFEGFAQLISFACGRFGLYDRDLLGTDQTDRYSTYVLVFSIGYFLLSYILVFGAERLTRLAFNEPSPNDDTEDYTE